MVNTRAIQFMGLNAVRVLSIISLLLVFASTILVIVTNVKAVNAFEASKTGDPAEMDCDYIEGSTVPNQPAGVFWAIVSSLLIMFQTIILLFSEVSWPMKFFDRFFPVLGTQFGLGALGIFQALISTQILSHHVDDFTLVAAFFLFALACINMLLGLIFRESAKEKRSIRAWRAEAKGVLPTSVDQRPQFVGSQSYVNSVFSQGDNKGMWTEKVPVTIVRNDSTATWSSTDKAGFGFGRQGEKAAGLRGFILQRPEESLPRYASPSPAPTSGNGHHVAFAAQPTTTHVSLSRAASSVTSTSSFYSPNPEEEEQIERERAARYARRERRHRDESYSRESSRSRSERSETPIKSSRPAAF
ncbi:hypothetical protein CVT24_002226 [Panaeolus cyanescens]|uniref:DUF7598 domain-containing protein n=1 Tax=Panaeolus cyanescens TaxID=181874 RepID=A0A409YIH2_9AGAR|nr:hypothetical protein CVT24_002226 [Panaeolus cyanescens]